jgi:DNA-3-methyladenine glycosylase I
VSKAAALPADGKTRCGGWTETSLLERDYHDTEWGVPMHDDRILFEMITLEGAQAGLSWRTVLARREDYRCAFHNFDIARVAAMTDAELDHVLTGTGVIRHRQKIASTRENARIVLAIIAEHGSLDAHLWSFVNATPIVSRRPPEEHTPATTDLSDAISKDLQKRGLRFMGSTICYAFMQAVGMVNDHRTICFRHPDNP